MVSILNTIKFLPILFLAASAFASDRQFQLIRYASEDAAMPGGAIYVQNGYALFSQHEGVSTDGEIAEGERLFAVNVSGLKTPDRLLEFGKVIWAKKGVPFVLQQLVTDAHVGRLSAFLHEAGMACGAVVALRGKAIKVAKPFKAPLLDPQTNSKTVHTAVATVNAKNIETAIKDLTSIHTRYHSSTSGEQVADILSRMYTAYAGARQDIEIAPYEHSGRTEQSSLIIRIKGTTMPSEIVVLGSHLDSINFWGGTNGRSPGADDNASGTATNLEVFRVLMESGYRPERTVEIHAYAAEEIGLVGSNYIAEAYAAAAKDVVSMVQHDMNLYSANGQTKVWLVSNNTNTQLNDVLEGLLDNYVGVPHERKNLSAGNSDHYSWTTNGYAAAFPFEDPANYNENIHTASDTIANSGNFAQAAAFAKLGVAYLMHYAGGA